MKLGTYMRVRDVVRRKHASGADEIGRILADVPETERTWLVTAGGKTYRDAEPNLEVIYRHPAAESHPVEEP